jgi:hypothetical protein
VGRAPTVSFEISRETAIFRTVERFLEGYPLTSGIMERTIGCGAAVTVSRP